MMHRSLRAGAWVLALASCTSPSAPVVEGVQAELTSEGLEVRNFRSDAIYYFAIERGLAALVDWAPCIGPGPCPHIDPGDTETISHAALGWTAGSSEALLYWWEMVADGHGGVKVDSIRTILVRQ